MYRQVFKDSVALCNIGAALLENGNNQDIQLYFQVALKLLKSGQSRNNDIHDGISSIKYRIAMHENRDNDLMIVAQNLLQLGQRRLLESSLKLSTRSYDIRVLSDRFDPNEIEKDLMEPIGKDVVFFGRLEVINMTQFDVIDPDHGSGIVSALAVQNIASTYLCQAYDLNCSDPKAKVLLDAAYLLYGRSEKILREIVYSSSSTITIEAAFVMYMVLQNMMRTTYRMGDTNPYQETCYRFHILLDLFKKLTLLGCYDNLTLHAAVA
jgi:hypothetical protein